MKWIYKPLDSALSFNDDHGKKMERAKVINREELKPWTIFTITLPIVTFFLSAVMNVLLSQCVIMDLGKIVNNGSLPIIAFGIVSSAVSYLVEHLKDGDPDIYAIRKRVMAVSLLLLFTTASLFLFQSLNVVSERLQGFQHATIFIFSILIATYSIRLGRYMYLLQSTFADDYAQQEKLRVDKITDTLKDRFGSEQNEGTDDNYDPK